MKEENINKYTKEEENTELVEEIIFDLENKEDLENLLEEIDKPSIYFKPEVDVTYKLQLTTPKVQKVEKEFDGETINKYIIGVKTVNAAKEEFEGIWECGISVLKPITKGYENKDTVFKVTKTGKGTDTRYSVIKDFN